MTAEQHATERKHHKHRNTSQSNNAIARRVNADLFAQFTHRVFQHRFQAYNHTLIEGRAPDALAELPAPDAVFIGGTKGGMEAVLDAVLSKNPNARVCISAIALETLGAAIAALTARGLTAEVTQIAVSRTKPAGRLHLLMANNPIFLITGTRK